MSERRTDLVGAIREEQRDAGVARVPRQLFKKLDAAFIAPMQVFDDDEHGSISGDAENRLQKRMEQAAFLLLRLDSRKRVIREEAAQLR